MLIMTGQLVAVGISKNAIGTRCRRHTLHRLHHGVYLYGPGNLLPGAREFAAALACGPSGVVSHRSAAILWGLVGDEGGEDVHITAVGESPRSRTGIRIHRVAHLPTDERRLKDGIPVTSPARTLLDLASQAGGDELERAIAEAYALRLTTEAQIRALLARHPRRPGVSALRAELDREGGPALTRREGERRMLKLIREADLPAPLVNRKVAGYRADFLWPKQRLIVEVDGFQFHGHRLAFERDRKRDAAHILAGYRVIRFTWRRLTEERVAVAVTIARALVL
jgi:very-short-patch-repair endonuclease